MVELRICSIMADGAMKDLSRDCPPSVFGKFFVSNVSTRMIGRG
jgi:hypothetical protein